MHKTNRVQSIGQIQHRKYLYRSICPEYGMRLFYLLRGTFDVFQIVAISFIFEFSIDFCCFVFDVKELLKVKFVVYYVMTNGC